MIDETAAEIAAMQTHSSSVVAVKAARALRDLLDREFATVEEYERSLERNSGALRRANPSHASLQTTQRDICERVVGTADNLADAKAATADAIAAVVEQVEHAKAGAAANARDLLDDGTTILTHDYSSTVLAAIESALADGDELTVYVTEARPRFIGRKTARELATLDGVETHLIVDSACGHYLSECDRVMFGMSAVVEETLYNRVGTFPISAAANEQGVPVTAVGSSAKIVDGGFAFENDFRAASEVLPEPAEGFAVDNPAYDATPLSLLDSIVTDEGTEAP
jgi:translation initiation factor eIF-2B subunit delta